MRLVDLFQCPPSIDRIRVIARVALDHDAASIRAETSQIDATCVSEAPTPETNIVATIDPVAPPMAAESMATECPRYFAALERSLSDQPPPFGTKEYTDIIALYPKSLCGWQSP